jgi:hypothetical protein
MAVSKEPGSALHDATAAKKNGRGTLNDSYGWGMDSLSRWPRLSCHNLVGISAILSAFVSIVGVSWPGKTGNLAFAIYRCIVYILHV